MEIFRELLNTFKAVEIKTRRKRKPNEEILKQTLKYGFTFSSEIFYNYTEADLKHLISIITKDMGITPEQMNSSFHKSWKKIKEAPMIQLLLEQLLHYITTYGFESWGIYDEDSVYIPHEKLEIPDITEDLKIVVIKGYKKEEFKEKTLELLRTGIALHEDTIRDVVKICKWVEIDQENISDIKNKEVKISLCAHLNIFPDEPTEFLRYLLFRTTGKTLLIKDRATIEMIKASPDDGVAASLLHRYNTEYSLERIAQIFHRFKPLFLAYKTQNSMKPLVNKLRKLAVNHHKPMKSDLLNDVTGLIRNGIVINKENLKKTLSKANSFRKIRLAYALAFRTRSVGSIMYKIRNGKSFATDFYTNNRKEYARIFDIVIDSLVEGIKDNVNKKKIYIPSYIKYALPATEKQFTGNLPSGTCVTVPSDMIAGVHWFNVGGNRIDLDLSLLNVTVGKIGWDSSYRTSGGNIMFSGDVTDPNQKTGASELFYIRRQIKQEFIMMLNYYNFREDVEVPFNIMVAKEKVSNFGQNFMINPNNIVCISKSKINEKQKVLGLLIITTKGSRFYFCETGLGNIRSSRNKPYIEQSRMYMVDFYKNMIDLKYILEKAGAEIVDSIEESDIDLSPENLEKDSIIKLLI